MKKLLKFLVVGCALISLNCFASETVEGAKKDYEVFKSDMSKKLDDVERELVVLKEKAKQKSSEAQTDSILELEKTKVKLKTELESMKQTGSSSWKKMKASFAASVDKLNSKVQKKLKD